jgi:phosphatidate cytidylyltransferase
MRNLGIRVILWFVAVPALVAIVVFLPYLNHLALNIIVVVVSGLGAAELATLFERKVVQYRTSSVIIPLLGAAIPLVVLLVRLGLLGAMAPYITLIALFGLILLVQIFRHTAQDFQHTLTSIAANFTVVVYPGLFLAFIIRMSEFAYPSVVILTFLCSVFFNDTMAYIAGGLYRLVRERLAQRHGREWTPRIVFPVSPKKTLAGFIGGFLLSPVVLIASNAIFPEAFPGGWVTAMLIGAGVGAATIVGDLIESAIKRSATSKDSGQLIPGRGGVLDSVDSVLYAAPVFYYLLRCTL